jgi:sarcosine oxidase subunit beta
VWALPLSIRARAHHDGGVSTKAIVCRCEDVTLDDIEHAGALGYHHIEEVKRYTGLGTGPCEGKECMATCALLIARIEGCAPSEIPPFTARPPVAPVALGTLARGGEIEDEP